MKRIHSFLFSTLLFSQAHASPIASYSFSGNTLDNSGNGHDGTLHGATYTTDRFGTENSALSFDGVDDYVDLPNLGLSGAVSVSGWFSFSGDIWPHHIALLGQATSYQERWQLGVSNQEVFWYDRRGSDNSPYKIERETESNVWHNLVAVVSADSDSPTKVGLYMDGNYLGSVSSRGFQDMGNDYQIGSFFTEWGWEYSLGMIDDINIYDHALTNEEIQDLYHAPAVPEPGSIALILFGLIAWMITANTHPRIKRPND